MTIGEKGGRSRYDRLVRDCFRSGGYVFAGKAGDITRKEGIGQVARLASNENPNPPSQEAIRLGCAALNEANRYPDETMDLLVQSLARSLWPLPFYYRGRDGWRHRDPATGTGQPRGQGGGCHAHLLFLRACGKGTICRGSPCGKRGATTQSTPGSF